MDSRVLCYDCNARARESEASWVKWSTGVFLSEINNAGKKAGKQTNATDNVTCRASLASLDDCRRGVREQLSDRWGQSRPLYRRSARSGGADLYITRESLFRRGRAAAPEGSRESGARRPGVTPARNLRDTRSSAALAFSICLRRSLAPATHVAYIRVIRATPDFSSFESNKTAMSAVRLAVFALT